MDTQIKSQNKMSKNRPKCIKGLRMMNQIDKEKTSYLIHATGTNWVAIWGGKKTLNIIQVSRCTPEKVCNKIKTLKKKNYKCTRRKQGKTLSDYDSNIQKSWKTDKFNHIIKTSA